MDKHMLRAAFGCCSLRTGSILWCIIGVLFVTLDMTRILSSPLYTARNRLSARCLAIACYGLFLVISVQLIVGVTIRAARMMQPWIAVFPIKIFVTVARGYTMQYDDIAPALTTAAHVLLPLIAVCGVYLWVGVYLRYRELKENDGERKVIEPCEALVT